MCRSRGPYDTGSTHAEVGVGRRVSIIAGRVDICVTHTSIRRIAMPTQATGTLEITSWDEQPYVEIDDERKLTTTTVTQNLQGDVVGEGSATWLGVYRADGTAEFVGFQRIVGTIGDAEGSIVL